jgi:hypothetical protein
MKNPIKINYRFRQFYNKSYFLKEYQGIYPEYLNQGMYLMDEKIHQTSTFNNDLIVVDIIGKKEDFELNKLILEHFESKNKLEVMVLEEI